MADQTKILKALAASAIELTIDEIAKRCGIRLRHGKARKQILECLGRLMEKKLVARADAKSFTEAQLARLRGREPRYIATVAGGRLIAEGKRVTSGANGPRSGPRKPLPDTRRQKFWNALRIAKKVTLADLASAAGGVPEKSINNARVYLKALSRAGIVTLLPVRAKGHAPTSPGFLRYALARDLGQFAPMMGAKGVFDPNTRETIPYAEKK